MIVLTVCESEAAPVSRAAAVLFVRSRVAFVSCFCCLLMRLMQLISIVNRCIVMDSLALVSSQHSTIRVVSVQLSGHAAFPGVKESWHRLSVGLFMHLVKAPEVVGPAQQLAG